ncbi:c-Myc-binding protein-like isoform X1 [Crassostrea angulata]|uniref:c-Myc-binding protein-like isoform X1 n=1 Tax=Magallana angulata TaxID=2784310 RepID=UPI0022B0A78B|nr:c-Myc-binding protein-like isoform X1 [Crassostrea angulata]
MTTYRGADSKREEFRRYLEKAGVLDALTKVLVGLYEEPEKPNNALDFLKQHLGASGPETADVEALKLEVTELRQKVEQLTEENQELKAKACIVTCPYVSVVLYPKML